MSSFFDVITMFESITVPITSKRWTGIACWWTIQRHDDNDADDNHDDASDDAGDDDSDDDGDGGDDDSDDDGERGLHVGGPSSAVSGEQ